MKYTKQMAVLLIASSVVLLGACRKKKSAQPDYANGIDEGHTVELNQDSYSGTVNMAGGELTVSGDTDVSGDINMNDHRESDVTVTDNAEVHKVNMESGTLVLEENASVKTDINMNAGDEGGNVTVKDNATVSKVNMHNGTLVLAGNAEIKTDLNLDEGTVTIGDKYSTLDDTVKVGHFNAHDTVFVVGGVFYIERDLNLDPYPKAYLSVAEGARVIVGGTFNRHSDVCGNKNITAGHVNGEGGTVLDEPCKIK